MTSIVFLLLALGLSALGTSFLVWRHRQPNRIDSGIKAFHHEMRALDPNRRIDTRASRGITEADGSGDHDRVG